jgi:membrane protease YdiL (CAAX protease family)
VPFLLRGGYPDLPGELGEEIGWRGYLVRRYRARPLTAAAITMPVWTLFHLPVVFFPAQRGHYLQNAAFLASIAVQAAPIQALFLWSRSVWPCAVFHLAWNTCNELVLGDVYAWAPGLFSGQFWVFNGEGPFGLLLNGVVALCLLRRWRHGGSMTEASGAEAP